MLFGSVIILLTFVFTLVASTVALLSMGVLYSARNSAVEVRDSIVCSNIFLYVDVNPVNCEVITRDVCIFGGGSSGTFSAIQLQKAGKSVVVIERENVMGGHTNTYTDPITKKTVDYGVIIFENLQIVKDYFDYLAVPWKVDTFPINPTGVTKYFDFSTNTPMNNITAQNGQVDLQQYVAQLLKYPKLAAGFYLPTPVPDDLLLPFGELVTKYNISDTAVKLIYHFGQGLGDILRQPTLYVLKNFGLNIVMTDFVEGFVFTKSNNNMDIYNKAYKMLKDNVLLQSRPIQVVRNGPCGVEVTVMTTKGVKLIKAKKLLVSIPPQLCNLRGFELSAKETSLFSQFGNSGYYTGLVRNTGLPPNMTVENVNTKNPYGLPTFPGLYAVGPTAVDGLYDIKYGSPVGIPDDDVKADVLKSLLMLQKMGIAKETTYAPKFVEYRSHTPFELSVSVEAIKAGFYERLYGLQGEQNTFYTGAAFHSQNSGLLWQFTNDFVLPSLLEEL